MLSQHASRCLRTIDRALHVPPLPLTLTATTLHWVASEHAAIDAWIQTHPSPGSKQNYYSALTAALRIVSPMDESERDRLLTLYRAKMLAQRRLVLQREEMQELDASERFHWKSYDEIVAIRERFHAQTGWPAHRRYVIMCCYTMTPPIRGEYRNMRLATLGPSESAADYINREPRENWMLLKGAEAQGWLVINTDKLTKTGKAPPAVIEMNPELSRVMRASMRTHPREYVIGARPITQAAYMVILASCGVGVRNFRSAYISHFYPAMCIAERNRMADRMRHSHQQAELSYLKLGNASGRASAKL